MRREQLYPFNRLVSDSQSWEGVLGTRLLRSRRQCCALEKEWLDLGHGALGEGKKGLRLRGEDVGLELAYDALNPR